MERAYLTESRALVTRIENGGLDTCKLAIQVLGRVRARFISDNCSDMAARVSFYFVLSLFPFCLVVIALLGWIPTTSSWSAFADWVTSYLPPYSRRLLLTTMLDLSRNYTKFLSFGLIAAVWSASSGFHSLIEALSTAYGVRDRRSYVRKRFIAMCATFLAALFLLICFSIWNLGHIFRDLLSTDIPYVAGTSTQWTLVRWIITVVLLLLGIDLLNYFLPGQHGRWRWISPGSVLVTLAFAGGTTLFNLYITHNTQIPRLYGALAGFIVLMLWIYAANLILLVGAETDIAVQEVKRDGTRG